MSINIVAISGNLTRDPQIKSSASGTTVMTLGIAVNDRRQNAQGEWLDYPNYVDCILFGKRADSLQKYLAKGTHVTIQGKLRWSSWEDKGQKRSKLEVVVDNLDFTSNNKPDLSTDDIPF